jgi:hypothetical protein
MPRFTTERRRLEAPSRLAEPKPVAAPPPDPEATLVSIGGWRILGLDSTKKRAAARCLNCSTIREISTEALRNGGVSCGCARARTLGAAAERIVAASRHRGRR